MTKDEKIAAIKEKLAALYPDLDVGRVVEDRISDAALDNALQILDAHVRKQEELAQESRIARIHLGPRGK